jgi:hypothetical protein
MDHGVGGGVSNPGYFKQEAAYHLFLFTQWSVFRKFVQNPKSIVFIKNLFLCYLYRCRTQTLDNGINGKCSTTVLSHPALIIYPQLEDNSTLILRFLHTFSQPEHCAQPLFLLTAGACAIIHYRPLMFGKWTNFIVS